MLAIAVITVLFAAVGCGGGGDGATTFRLKIETKGGGTVSPTGTIKYTVGTEATVTATANEGHVFTGWSGASTATTPSVTITMNSNQTLTANFERFTATFTDSRDGKSYRRVRIGNQTWMAENLNFQTGNSWCYGNDESNCQKYGRLYTWNAAMNACPAGWRLPNDEDWNDLVAMAGGSETAGKKLKSQTGWNNNGNGTDEFGFSALPGGGRYADGGFDDGGSWGLWWSAAEDGAGWAWRRLVYWSLSGVLRWNYNKSLGFSLRCVRD